MQEGQLGVLPELTLPSFSMEEDDDEEDEDEDEDDDEDDDEDEEVDFPKQGAGPRRRQTIQTGKQPCTDRLLLKT